MAHLEVEPKPARPWWIWVLVGIVLIALSAFLFDKCGSERTMVSGDTTMTLTDTVGVARIAPNWKDIDFDAATVKDVDITDNDIVTRGNENYTIYSLGENILFPTDGSVISANGEAKLRMISDVLQKRFEGATIGIFGSTDSTGPVNENKALGQQRAEAVKNWLVSAGNLAADRLSVQSLGEKEPVASNETAAGRQQNRNVAIVVFPNK